MFPRKRPSRKRVVMTRPLPGIPSRALAPVEPKAGLREAHVLATGREVRPPPPLEPSAAQDRRGMHPAHPNLPTGDGLPSGIGGLIEDVPQEGRKL